LPLFRSSIRPRMLPITGQMLQKPKVLVIIRMHVPVYRQQKVIFGILK